MANSDKQTPKGKENQASDAKNSLQMSSEDLLDKIFYSSTVNIEPSKITSQTIAYFSSLLIILSRQAEKSTKKIVRLTWFLFGLTVALLIVAIIQIIIFKQETTKTVQTTQTDNDYQIPQEKNKSVQTETHKQPLSNKTNSPDRKSIAGD